MTRPLWANLGNSTPSLGALTQKPEWCPPIPVSPDHAAGPTLKVDDPGLPNGNAPAQTSQKRKTLKQNPKAGLKKPSNAQDNHMPVSQPVVRIVFKDAKPEEKPKVNGIYSQSDLKILLKGFCPCDDCVRRVTAQGVSKSQQKSQAGKPNQKIVEMIGWRKVLEKPLPLSRSSHCRV